MLPTSVEPRTLCRDCEGRGFRIIPRMGALGFLQLDFSRLVTGFETRDCVTCAGTGWLRGMVPPV